MKKCMKSFTEKVLMTAFILSIFSINSFARIFGNGSGNGYEPGTGGGGITQASLMSASIEDYVIQGAGYYLNACSDIMALSNRVEQPDFSSLDLSETGRIIDNALFNVKNTVLTYENLIKQAENTPYNPVVIAKLMNFDYTGYRTGNGLNSAIFLNVENYLKRGDITGAYKFICGQLKAIESLLSIEKTNNEAGALPTISNLWNLNELSSETLLFGQYIARVFSSIK